jgi:hypothetical protein
LRIGADERGARYSGSAHDASASLI